MQGHAVNYFNMPLKAARHGLNQKSMDLLVKAGGKLQERVMQLEDVKITLAAHKAELKDRGIKSLAVFGSVARGDAGPNSDVDLLVEFDRAVGLFHFIHVRDYLEHLLNGAQIDMVMREAVCEELKEDIYEEAINVL